MADFSTRTIIQKRASTSADPLDELDETLTLEDVEQSVQRDIIVAPADSDVEVVIGNVSSLTVLSVRPGGTGTRRPFIMGFAAGVDLFTNSFQVGPFHSDDVTRSVRTGSIFFTGNGSNEAWVKILYTPINT